MYSVSVIIPAHNEEKNIEKLIGACLRVLPSLFNDFEIIVVNDGSTDATGNIADRLAREKQNIQVFHHPKNTGMGSAIRTGIASAKNELIFTTCADLQFDIAEIKKFLPMIENSDIVIGRRLNRDYNVYRRINTLVYHILLNLMFGLKFSDPSWVKMFRKNVFDKISIASDGFFWETEVLIKARRNGYAIKEVDTNFQKNATASSHGGNPLRVIEAFWAMVKFWFSPN